MAIRPISNRITKDKFRLKPFMTFDEVKRNMKSFVEAVYNERERISVGSSESNPQFLVYDYDLADDEGDEVDDFVHVSPSSFTQRSTSYQTILRYEGKPLVLGTNKPMAVIKMHPDWSSPLIEEARQAFLQSGNDARLARIEKKLDQLLDLVKKKN